MASVDRRTLIVGAGATALLARRTPAAQPPYRIPITLTDTRVLVDCTIAGQGPYRFVIDTGGTIGLIELKLARELKLKQVGTSRLALRQADKPYPIYAVPDLAFGGTVRQPMSAIDGVDIINFRDGAVGSIAAGALSAGDAELDFAAGEWRIHRAGPPDRTGWTAFHKGIFQYGNVNGSAFLAADATLGGRPFRFGLDTGMPTATYIYRRTAEAAGLWDAPRWTPASPGGKGRIVRAPLVLAGETIDAIITVLDRPEWSAFPAGVIGLPILRRFDIATAAATRTVYLRRNALLAPPARYNRAGLWIERDGANARIAVVGPGSPAAQADLRAGDRLIGADFDRLLDRMFAPAGTDIPLTVERAGTRRDVILRLADFL